VDSGSLSRGRRRGRGLPRASSTGRPRGLHLCLAAVAWVMNPSRYISCTISGGAESPPENDLLAVHPVYNIHSDRVAHAVWVRTRTPSSSVGPCQVETRRPTCAAAIGPSRLRLGASVRRSSLGGVEQDSPGCRWRFPPASVQNLCRAGLPNRSGQRPDDNVRYETHCAWTTCSSCTAEPRRR
jgi:hypothetical protein